MASGVKVENNFNGAQRGGFIYTATLILYLAVSLLGRIVLSAFNASQVVLYAVNSLLACAVFITVVTVTDKNLNACAQA